MNTVLKVFLSMSCSGTLLILFLFLNKRVLKDKISRQWQYYIWLIVILRLLFPFEFPFREDINLMGNIYQAIGQTVTYENVLLQWQSSMSIQDNPSVFGLEQENENMETSAPAEILADVHPFRDMISLLTSHIWLLWLTVAFGMLVRKATLYQSFVQYICSGATPVSDIDVLDRLSTTAKQMGIKKPVELCVNPQISSPMLKGFFHPCILLPGLDICEKNFQYIMIHELTHYKRKDMFYKWLVQVTVCLHWFNPFVYFMGREITKACEFSCDEAVLARGYTNAQDYGKTLLDAMAAAGRSRDFHGAVTLSENKKILKERLRAIMNFERKSKAVRILTGMLTLCIILGTFVFGVYPVAAASDRMAGKSLEAEREEDDIFSAHEKAKGQAEAFSSQRKINAETVSSQAEKYYEAESLSLFQISFSHLDEKAQSAWLERIYTDDKTSFFSVAVRTLDGDSPLLSTFAEKAYTDGESAFFSILADSMEDAALESWLDRALEDERYNFQSILFDKLDMDDEKDAREKEWEEQKIAEYQAVGVTKNGKNYYYQEQLVNIFLDIRQNQSFYTLDMNPAGIVNIKVTRGEDGKITGVAYMSETEAAELLGDMGD